MSRILLIGGGGFAKEAQEIAELRGLDVIGYVADRPGQVKLPLLGTVEDIPTLRAQFDVLVVAFGAVDRRSLARRASLISRIEEQGFQTQSLISPHATVSKGVTVGDGTIVAHGVVISVDAVIGRNVILNTSAVVGHDAIIGARTIVAPGAFVGGAARIGEDCLVGPKAMILEGRSVGNQVVISLGGAALRDIADGKTVAPMSRRVLS